MTTSRSSDRPVVLGPDGKPWTDTRRKESGEFNLSRAIEAYRIPAPVRAREPLSNHAVFFMAVAIRMVQMAQAPFGVYTETADAVRSREMAARTRGMAAWTPPRGVRRTAVQRHLTRSGNPARFFGARSKSLELYPEHPLFPAFSRPSPVLMQPSLMAVTSAWLSMRGEAFWLKISESGAALMPGETPVGFWPLNPDRIREKFDRATNQMVAWEYSPRGSDPSRGAASRVMLGLHEVVHFKYPNPMNIYRGLSPISALAMNIEMDLAIDTVNRATIENNMDPGGVFMTDTKVEREKWNAWLEDRHTGPMNRRRALLLDAGDWDYKSFAFSPEDMQHLDTKKWDREQVFGTLRVPPSTVGITNELNYATQLGQDKNLWDKSILPDMLLIEQTVDWDLLYDEPDTIVCAFDVSGVEALRQGLREQIGAAREMCGVELHTPPEVAYQTVGLDVAAYPGSDVALVNGLAATPIDQVLNPDPVEPLPPGDPFADPDDPDEPEPGDDDHEQNDLARVAAGIVRGVRQIKGRAGFDKVQARTEKTMSGNWSAWVAKERSLQLKRFDEVARQNNWADAPFRRSLEAVLRMPANADSFLIKLSDLQARIRATFRPTYAQSLLAAFQSFAEEIGGVPIFELDDPRVLSAIADRTKVIFNGPPVTLQRQLRNSLAEGLKEGETIQEMRSRVSEVFDLQRSHYKTLQVARTESAGFLNTARERMFEAQQIDRAGWSTAGDEHVRETHVWFGRLKSQPLGTNYLEIDGYPGKASGILAFPGDSRASAGEVVNCRCTRVID